MAVELITKDDLQQFKQELLAEIKILLQGSGHVRDRLLKSYQVKELLNVSTGTLHKLRQNGTLTFVQIDGVFLYSEAAIQALIKAQTHRRR